MLATREVRPLSYSRVALQISWKVNQVLPYSLKQTTAPTTEPVTLEELKSALRVTHNDDDAELSNLIEVARRAVERDTGRSLITQTWTLKRDDWPSSCEGVALYYPPVQSVTSVTYVDTAGTTQTWSSSLYTLDTQSEPGLVRLAYSQSWPSLRGDYRGITVTYVAGYGDDADDVPYDLRQAVMLYARMQYDGMCDKTLNAYERIVSCNMVGVYP